MKTYIIEHIISKEDKRMEFGYFRLKSRNGSILMTSEKYKNINFSKRIAIKLSDGLQAKYKELDRRIKI